ncbi:MAG: hypothetical protein AAGC67_19855, partial [Myxococcota bacterium]
MNPNPFTTEVRHRLAPLLALALLAGLATACSDCVASTRGEAGPAVAIPEARLRVRIDPVRLDALPTEDRITATVRAFHRATITAETQGRVL